MDIPFLDMHVLNASFNDAVSRGFQEVLDSAHYILGQQGVAFEQEWALWLGAEHSVGVASGTDALLIALMALDLDSDAEVLLPANTCVPTISAVCSAGLVPRLVDASPDNLTMCPVSLEKQITAKTRVVIPVHLYGHPCDMDSILAIADAHNLVVIEDCAQSHGTLYKQRTCGTIGTMGAFSFYPSKNLGAYGDAGAVATNDAKLAARIRSLRVYGQHERYIHEIEGINSRMDEIQASILRVKLRSLDEHIAERRRLAQLYAETLNQTSIVLPFESEWAQSSYHLYPIRTPERDRLQAHLQEKGIGTLIHYPIPLHLQPAYSDLPYSLGDFPVAEDAAAQLLSLPLYPGLSDESVKYISDTINGWS